MATAAPHFVDDVISAINLTVLVVALGIEAFAFINCLVQRPDAFAAISTLPKGAWLALTAGAMVATLLFNTWFIMFSMIGIAIALVYVLDVRPALRDAVDGHGPW